jgi:hypothetical protein
MSENVHLGKKSFKKGDSTFEKGEQKDTKGGSPF